MAKRIGDELRSLNNSILALKTRQNTRSDVGRLFKYSASGSYSIALKVNPYGVYTGHALVVATFEATTAIEAICAWNGSISTGTDDDLWETVETLQAPGVGGSKTFVLSRSISGAHSSSVNINVNVEVLTTQPGQIKLQII